MCIRDSRWNILACLQRPSSTAYRREIAAMKPRADSFLLSYALGIGLLISGIWLASALAAVSPTLQRLPNGDVRIEQSTQAGQYYRIEASADLQAWALMVTLLSPGLLQHTDSAAGYFPKR